MWNITIVGGGKFIYIGVAAKDFQEESWFPQTDKGWALQGDWGDKIHNNDTDEYYKCEEL